MKNEEGYARRNSLIPCRDRTVVAHTHAIFLSAFSKNGIDHSVGLPVAGAIGIVFLLFDFRFDFLSWLRHIMIAICFILTLVAWGLPVIRLMFQKRE